jgi:hypothetical protein
LADEDFLYDKFAALRFRIKGTHCIISTKHPEAVFLQTVIFFQVVRRRYGNQLWGYTKQSNVEIIQRFQNKVLRHMVNASWYIRNNDLHRDLQVDVVSSEIQRFAQKNEERLHHHENAEAIQLLDNTCIVRRLQRKKKPFELV